MGTLESTEVECKDRRSSPSTVSQAVIFRLLIRGALPRWIAGTVLLAAAYLKFGAGPIEGWGTVPHKMLVSLECALGLWLISGYRNCLARITSLLLFLVFSAFTTKQLVSGHKNCGCFGHFELHPAITLVVDLALACILTLSLSRTSFVPASLQSRTRSLLQPSACLVLILILGLIWYPRPIPKCLTASLTTQATQPFDWSSLGTVSGKLIILEPEKWIGKPCPLLDALPNSNELTKGEWIILVVREGCSTCEETLPRYRGHTDTSGATWGQGSMPRIAIIQIPPEGKALDVKWANYTGALPDRYEWFATTPVRVQLFNGSVKSIASGEHALTTSGS